MFKDKLMKKLHGKKDLDPSEKQAKLANVKELSRQAGSLMSEKVHPLKKVSVASDSKEGLHEGLAKAANLVDHAPDMEHDPEKIVEGAEEDMGADLDHDNEANEPMGHLAKVLGHDDVEAEHADKSPEELDAHIAKLTALKHKKLAGKA